MIKLTLIKNKTTGEIDYSCMNFGNMQSTIANLFTNYGCNVSAEELVDGKGIWPVTASVFLKMIDKISAETDLNTLASYFPKSMTGNDYTAFKDWFVNLLNNYYFSADKRGGTMSLVWK